jgi:hypothetical protein
MPFQCCLVDESYKLTGQLAAITGLPLGNSEIRLISMIGDWAAFQVLIQSDDDYAVNIGKSAWFSQKGAIQNIRLDVNAPFPILPSMNLEGMVADDDAVYKADILLSQKVVEVAKNKIQAVWVELDLSQVVAGKYEGDVFIYQNRMLEPEIFAGSLHFVIEVKNYAKPLPHEYTFHLDLWQHLSNIARKHEVDLWGNDHFQVLERYVQSLAQLGQKAVTILASEIPWRGQYCYLDNKNPSNLFEYSIVPISRTPDGEFCYDFSIMQRYIDLCFRCGIDKEIEVFGLVGVWTDEVHGFGKACLEYPDGILLRYLDQADRCYKFMRDANQIEQYIKMLASYFNEHDLMHLVRVVADEPEDIVLYRKSVDKLLSIAPGFRLKTAINHSVFINEFKEMIADYVPSMYCLFREYEIIKSTTDIPKDKRILWYVCCSPAYPNTFIGSNLLESRFIGILTYYLGLDGFLRWNYTVWPDDPRRSIQYGNYPAGDTNFVYPACNGSVLLTLRYKNLKRGIEDFELLKSAARQGKDDIVSKAIDLVVKEKNITLYFNDQPYDLNLPVEKICSLNFNDYQLFREILLDALAIQDKGE